MPPPSPRATILPTLVVAGLAAAAVPAATVTWPDLHATFPGLLGIERGLTNVSGRPIGANPA